MLVLGLSHRTASLAERERYALDADGVRALLRRLAPRVDEAVVVSTCNRTEIYAVGPEDGLPHWPGACVLREAAAVEHLFRVAAGLESALLGESEIVGQLRSAVALAAAAGTLGPRLEDAFAGALAASRRVRRLSGVGRGSGSLAAVVATAALAERRERGVLIIGAGRLARALAGALQGTPGLAIANRRDAGAHALGPVAVPWAELDRALARADVVISATSAPRPVLTAARIAALPVRPRVVFDLAVPRDVEPDAPTVVRDLESLVASDSFDWASAERAAALVRGEVARFSARRALEPVIEAVWRQAEATRREELARLGPLPAAERERLERVTAALMRKLLDGPSRRLRMTGDTERLDAFRDLFDVA